MRCLILNAVYLLDLLDAMVLVRLYLLNTRMDRLDLCRVWRWRTGLMFLNIVLVKRWFMLDLLLRTLITRLLVLLLRRKLYLASLCPDRMELLRLNVLMRRRCRLIRIATKMLCWLCLVMVNVAWRCRYLRP